ncbi:MAG: cation transporter [Erysipelotrichaceae bacterium]|nr:cation transporter [Erysipelotrichaceae bacterium]
MFEFLCKTFIKDYENTENSEVRERYGSFFSLFSILCNILMVIMKLIISYISNSISIRADALNNLSDVGSNLATLIGFRLSNKSPDADHPYGHGRMEYVSGLIVSFLILLVAFQAVKEALIKILYPQDLNFTYSTLAVLIISIAIKLLMAYVNGKAARMIDSETLKAASQDSLNDSLMTLAALVSVIFFRFSGINIDAYVGFAVSLFVLKAGIGIFREVLDTILGKAPDPKLIKQIEEDIMKHYNVLGIHDLILHDYGPSHRFMSLHAEVDASIPIMETHDMIDNIEKEIQEKYHILTSIHMDPIDTSDELAKVLKEKVRDKIREINESYNIHDFRLVKGNTHSNLIFDVLIPAEDHISSEVLKKQISEKVMEIDPSYRTVVTIDHSFV